MKVAIRVTHARIWDGDGARRLQPELAVDGFVAGRDRIDGLRKELGLRCRQTRKCKATTNANYALPVAEHLLDQPCSVTRPNQVGVADITYIPTGEGWLYLAGIKDLHTCAVVGYAMGERKRYQQDPHVAPFRIVRCPLLIGCGLCRSDRTPGRKFCRSNQPNRRGA